MKYNHTRECKCLIRQKVENFLGGGKKFVEKVRIIWKIHAILRFTENKSGKWETIVENDDEIC